MDNLDVNLLAQCASALPNWFLYAVAPFGAAGVAAHFDAVIKQPAAGSLWLLIRKPLSILAGNYGWAKHADQETLPEWWATNRKAFAAWIVNAAGEALKAEIAAMAAQNANASDSSAPNAAAALAATPTPAPMVGPAPSAPVQAS